jgi:hypothetical protein
VAYGLTMRPVDVDGEVINPHFGETGSDRLRNGLP